MNSYLNFLSRNKLYTLIEAFGLSMALGFIILLLCYARTEFAVGQKDAINPRTYAVGAGHFVGMTIGTPDAFFANHPEIKRWTRLVNLAEEADMLVGEDYFTAHTVAVDTNFFQLFNYELIGCNRQKVLTSDDEVIVSQSMARRAFGEDNPIGRQLIYEGKQLTVVGVMADLNPSSLFAPIDLIISMKVAKDKVRAMDQFGSTQIFVVLDQQTDPQQLADKLLDDYTGYWKEFYKPNKGENAMLWGSTLTPLNELYFSPLEKYDTYRLGGNKKQVQILLLVALVLLVSAIFNYINLSVAQTGNRAKEMTTRRVMGESDGGILRRYMGESLLFTSCCFLLGAFLAKAAKPLFDEWLSTSIQLTLDGWSLLVTVVLLLLVAVVSALLPTLFILRFKPIDVVKGTFRFKNKLVFSRLFIVAQNVLSCLLLAIGLTMWLQVHHLATLPCGYRTEGLIQVSAFRLGRQGGGRILLQQRLEALPCVKSVGRFIQLPCRVGHNGCHEGENQWSWLRYSQMDSTAFRQLGFRIVEQYDEVVNHKLWIDSETQRRYGISREKRFLGGTESQPEYLACGVINDYRSNDALYTPLDDSHNVIYMLSPEDDFSSLLVEVQGDDRVAAMNEVKRVCLEVTREQLGMPVELKAYYIDDFLNEQISGTRHTMILVLSFMMIATLISALGLLAMSIYYTQQRRKEIAVRKVMGATSTQAMWQLTQNFILLTVVAIVIAIPLSIKGMEYYLQTFYNRIDFPWWALVVAVLLSLLISLLSVSTQSYRMATMNPYDNIRTE